MTDDVTTPDRGPAPLVLGAYLRSLRLAKGLTPTAAAEAIRSSPSKINRMETGQAAQRWQDVSTLTRLYGVTDMDTITGAMRWTGRQTTDPTRFPGPIRDDAEGWMDRLRACEHHASEICVYASVTMPRIVQTTGYPVDHLTLLTSSAQPPRVPAHTVLPDNQTQDVTVLLDGAMLLRTLGNPLAMAAQMTYLQRLGASGTRILVVPLQAGVIPPPGSLYRFHLHGQEVFAEETWSAVYASGTDGQAARDRLAAGLQAAKDPEASAALLDAARRRFQLLAEDPASDPLLKEVAA
ncbi:Scr1 family TA system antitoxin-like transcriptional regulator [Streptomyces sp. S465]|uniref:Scr1 family TA system antitoxin-like transcriptional regulator n=1 Tax=Streptomyces sp. S465 TaxID=2979468 RepID=UPI0022A82D85|nr:Scr1 family TA system antitoxin-like transcriptional regulator [Streptomyces sp. S465]WAP56164.1 Scr1 family TA system antitoxin-like transcriptional regulator [Streptomyces sp. S465]